MNYIAILIIGIGMLIISYIIDLKSDIARMNIKLDQISVKIGICDELDEGLRKELMDLVAKGNKVKAIKKYRENTGSKLKEAKYYIESLYK